MNRTLLLKPLAVITAVLFLSGCGAANHHSEGGSYKASQVPRMTSQQARAGYAVSKSEAAPGDIVVFRVGGSGTGLHTGIYAGGDNFIHSPKPGKTVKMDQLQKKYWKEKLIGLRRVS